ncbi:hypothetical protein BD560DRAFT_369110 [Blakeslea trispora]|nr:hypothetical protein BD560DRAFT_369110 [Blakeslea trispora]
MEAISFSGTPANKFQHILSHHLIALWHDRISSTALRCLGFPVISSINQRQWVEEQLLNTVQSVCKICAQHNLSIRSRVAIANSIVLTKLWHTLRVVAFPQLFFRRLRLVVCQFVNRGIKPGFKYAHFCKPRSEGGLGLLDPQVQQHCLISRWPKLALTTSDSSSICQAYLQHTIRQHYCIGSPSLLSCCFPALRPPASMEYGFIMHPLFQTRSLIFCQVNLSATFGSPQTLLSLPLFMPFDNMSSEHRLGKNRSSPPLVGHFFLYDPLRLC